MGRMAQRRKAGRRLKLDRTDKRVVREIRRGSQIKPDRSTKAVGLAQQALAGFYGRAQA